MDVVGRFVVVAGGVADVDLPIVPADFGLDAAGLEEVAGCRSVDGLADVVVLASGRLEAVLVAVAAGAETRNFPLVVAAVVGRAVVVFSVAGFALVTPLKQTKGRI